MNASDTEADHPRLRRFFAANGVYAGLVIAVMTSGENIREGIVLNWAPSLAILALVEISTILVLQLMYRRKSRRLMSDLFPDISIESIKIRFGDHFDFDAIDAVYHEWFSPDLSIDDAEYAKLLLRNENFRVVEIKYSDNSRAIAGFYSIWPMRRETFEQLISGKLKEKNITANHVCQLSSDSAEVIYFTEICVSKNVQVGGLLLRDSVTYVASCLERYPKISAIGAWAYTDVGRSLVGRFCMSARKKPNGNLTEYFEVSRDVALCIPRPRNKFQNERIIRY